MSNTVLALVSRSVLSTALTAFHLNGYGHVIRVLDPDRAPLSDQLKRAGVDASRICSLDRVEGVVLFVHAPERTMQAAALAAANGATDVEVVSCGVSVAGIAPKDLIDLAQTRRGRRSGIRPEHRQDDQLLLAD